MSAKSQGDPKVGAYADGFETEVVKNTIELTPAAGDEIKQRFRASQFTGDVVVRIAPERAGHQVSVAFDYAMADGRDWLGQSQGVPIVVDRNIAEELAGRTVDFKDGNFFLS